MPALVDAGHQGGQAPGEGHHAGQVQAARGLLVAGLGHVAQQEQGRGEGEGDVEQEHGAPADVFGEGSADEGSQGGADGAEGEDGADGTALPFVLEVRGDDRDGHGEDQGRRAPLDDASGGEPGGVLRGGAHHGDEGEAGEPADEDAAPAEQVGGPAAGDHERPEGEHVAADQPLEVGGGGVEVAADDGEHQVEGEPVHLDQQHRDRGGHDDRPVAAVEAPAHGSTDLPPSVRRAPAPARGAGACAGWSRGGRRGSGCRPSSRR